jgi:hypothetical protein
VRNWVIIEPNKFCGSRQKFACRSYVERMPTHGSHMSTISCVRHAIGMRSSYDTHEIVVQTLHTVILLYIRYGNFNGITGENDLETISPDLLGGLCGATNDRYVWTVYSPDLQNFQLFRCFFHVTGTQRDGSDKPPEDSRSIRDFGGLEHFPAMRDTGKIPKSRFETEEKTHQQDSRSYCILKPGRQKEGMCNIF